MDKNFIKKFIKLVTFNQLIIYVLEDTKQKRNLFIMSHHAHSNIFDACLMSV